MESVEKRIHPEWNTLERRVSIIQSLKSTAKCPKCGRRFVKPWTRGQMLKVWIECEDCGERTDPQDSIEKAVEEWNRRWAA